MDARKGYEWLDMKSGAEMVIHTEQREDKERRGTEVEEIGGRKRVMMEL